MKPWVSVSIDTSKPHESTLFVNEVSPDEIKDWKRKRGNASGGKAKKERRAIKTAIVEMLMDDPQLSVKKIWSKFPGEDHPLSVKLSDGLYEVYRDGDEIVQSDPAFKGLSWKMRTLEGHVGPIRKKVKKFLRKSRTK